MTTYLVGNSESGLSELDFVLVDAVSEDAAIDRFIRTHVITEPDFLEYIASKIINDGVSEGFWMQTEEEQDHFNETGELIADEEVFQKRVRAYFAPHDDYATRYLDFYLSETNDEDLDEYGDSEADLEIVKTFPEDMLVYFVAHGNWATFTLIALDDIERL